MAPSMLLKSSLVATLAEFFCPPPQGNHECIEHCKAQATQLAMITDGSCSCGNKTGTESPRSLPLGSESCIVDSFGLAAGIDDQHWSVHETKVNNTLIKHGASSCPGPAYELGLTRDVLLQLEVDKPTLRADCSYQRRGLCSQPIFQSVNHTLVFAGWSLKRANGLITVVDAGSSSAFVVMDKNVMKDLPNAKLSIDLESKFIITGLWWQSKYVGDNQASLAKIGSLSTPNGWSDTDLVLDESDDNNWKNIRRFTKATLTDKLELTGLEMGEYIEDPESDSYQLHLQMQLFGCPIDSSRTTNTILYYIQHLLIRVVFFRFIILSL